MITCTCRRSCDDGSALLIERAVLAEILDRVRSSLPEAFTLDRPAWSQIAGRVALCVTACPLGHFDPAAGHCTEQGSSCRHFQRWLERLTVGSCRGWEER
ncbi:MAG: hypothetical protein HQ567_33195 [Candidatus Nealsonbacteria bacterium]|nr:hypothetical protein [Candidatus Nealsonbacteria bacterium]